MKLGVKMGIFNKLETAPPLMRTEFPHRKIHIHCWHSVYEEDNVTKIRRKILGNVGNCLVRNKYLNKGGYINYYVFDKCCKCNKVRKRLCEDYNVILAMEYLDYRESEQF